MAPYDPVGDIEVIRILDNPPDELERLTADKLMRKHRNVKTVLGQVGSVWQSQITQARMGRGRKKV